MFIQDHKPDIVALLEPKVSSSQADSICSSFNYSDWVTIEAVGYLGGIWILWKSALSVDIIDTHPQSVTLQVDDRMNQPWCLSFVYASPVLTLRSYLFTELTGQESPWMTIGDFNSVAGPDEVSNPATYSSARSSDFNDWIFREGLVDLGYFGTKFTWMRGLQSTTFKGARLDRALGNLEWALAFPDAKVKHLPLVQSDHCPLLVTTRSAQISVNCKRFRYNMVWATHPNFHSLMQQAWDQNRDIESNKASMARALTDWNRDVFGNVFHKKKKILARISGIQRRLAERASAELLKLEKKLGLELEEILYQEELLLWYQRSREEWIVSGDRNTRFYHIATKLKNSSARISKLKDDDGLWIVDEDKVREHISKYFMELFARDQLLSV
ncbi:PREDICTED: uncharacterized protein LOC109179535 isoform X1 [Ipomoea nil]|uniref:uncharacterized protein LOC109179535 isoform X1 n=1 Tax=Ipomoea nil TaxID=35883 RepID=UPI000900B99C|nr:PREDICTED: uncharacterized protein LOC109179535 isoform X1 [Ipomoea nil]XP_019184587.1 PREDICTED: uncharacterized protein LOC109179535 isoform X1 [Ipomoea nil]XP_019184588.1 PREDICTED: uncharacterized protein LOC109179535 isoform X1 [Ipomoea nil]